MVQRSDTRQRMVEAARQLIRERGYHAIALSDVLARSSAPRGSIYYHFPEGKAQIATEVAASHARAQVEEINRLAESARSPADLVGLYVGRAREELEASGFSRGCAIAPLVIEGGEFSDEIENASRRALTLIIEALELQLTVLGLEKAAARELANAVIAAVEGALVTSRALRGVDAFAAISVMLTERALALTTHDAPSRLS